MQPRPSRSSDDIDLAPASRWDDAEDDGFLTPSPLDDETPFLRAPELRSELGQRPAASDEVLATALMAADALGRLDARLRVADPLVRQGWQARMVYEEAAGLARLEGHIEDADELLRWEAGIRTGAPSPSLACGLRLADLLRFTARRSPRSFWTPRRQARLAGVLPGARTAEGMAALPDWLSARLSSPGALNQALVETLDPGNLARWSASPPLLAAADLAMTANRAGLEEMLGPGVVGILMAAWVWRAGLTDSLVVPVGLGFVGHAAEWRPWTPALFAKGLLGAVARGSKKALVLLDQLEAAHRRAIAGTQARRNRERLAIVIEALTTSPALPTVALMERIGLHKQATLNMLVGLRDDGIVREISGRDSYWVWALRT